MFTRRLLVLGTITIVLLAISAWRLGAGHLESGAAETQPREAPRPPMSESRAAPIELRSDTDAGAWNLEVVNALDGQPLPGVQVGVARASDGYVHHHGPPTFRGTTNDLGRLLVIPPEEGALQLNVSLPYFRRYVGDWAPGLRVMLEPLPAWKGRVVSVSGEPVAGARVLAVDEDNAETTSDADGNFVLALAQPGRVLAVRDDAMALVSAEDGAPLMITLTVPEQRVGVVMGRDERPLNDVTVTAEVRALSWSQTSAADGVYRIPKLGNLEPELRFEKPGYATAESPFREQIIMSRPSRLEGTLVDQRGRPLPGVNVDVGTLLGGDYFMEDSTTTTDELGRFGFEGLVEPEVVLRAVPEDTTEDDGASLTVQLPEGVTTRVALALPPARDPVTLEYRTVADVPLFSCHTLAAPSPPAGWSSSSGEIDTILLTRGRFHFSVTCPDGRGADELREVDPRSETALRFVVHQPDGGTPFRDELPPDVVRVRVVNAAGEPIEGATVRCDYRGQVDTNAEGRAVCEVREDDSAWPLLVRVQKGELTGLTRTAGKEEAVVTLRERVVLRGRVDGPIPPGNWTVAIRSAAVTTNVPLTGSSFTFEGHTPARTFVCVETVGEPHGSLGCAISEAGEEVVIRSGAMGKVSFTALDATGAPLEFPILYFDRNLMYGITANKGAVEFDAPPGEHVLILNVADSRARNEARFTVKPGETTALGSLKLE